MEYITDLTTSVCPASKLQFTLLSVKWEIFDVNLTDAADLCWIQPFSFPIGVDLDHEVLVVYGRVLSNAKHKKPAPIIA